MTWIEELHEMIEEDSLTYDEHATDKLHIMLVLKENGYKEKDFNTIINRMYELNLSIPEAIIKIKSKRK